MLVVQVFMESRNSWEAKGSGGQIELAIEKAAMTASCGMLSATAEAKIDRSDGGNFRIHEVKNIS